MVRTFVELQRGVTMSDASCWLGLSRCKGCCSTSCGLRQSTVHSTRCSFQWTVRPLTHTVHDCPLNSSPLPTTSHDHLPTSLIKISQTHSSPRTLPLAYGKLNFLMSKHSFDHVYLRAP